MTTNIDTRDVCCVGLELRKTSWVCAFAAPGDSKVTIHKIKAGDVDRLLGFLNSSNAKVERQLGRPPQIGLCYEVGYDGFWIARLLMARGIRSDRALAAALQYSQAALLARLQPTCS